MSLTHGHFFIADTARKQMSSSMAALVERNLNAYLLGSVGPDVLYWADYGKWPFGEFELALGGDPHVHGSGDMILGLVSEYLNKRRQSGKSEEPALAFLLGWITHWAADLYIHTLVDSYGGVYGAGTPRHIQLELVETRYIQGIRPDLNALTLANDADLALFLADAVTRAYPEARIRPNLPGVLSSPVEPSRKVAENKLEFLRFAHTGYTMIALGWDAANQGVSGATPVTAAGGVAGRAAWKASGAVLPDQKAFAGLLDPICLKKLDPTLSDIEVELDISDTGLYGKFLADYPDFAAGAAFRAASIIELVEEVVANGHAGEKGAGTTGAGLSGPDSPALTVLRAAVCPDGCTINILVPEEQFPLFDQELAKRLKDGTIRAQFGRKKLYYRGAYALAGQEPVSFDGYAPIEAVGTHGLMGSRTGRAGWRIPVDNPDQLAYSCAVLVSLTDKAAFEQPRYAQVEHRDLGEHWMAGDLVAQMKKCTCLEVLYIGPLNMGSSRDGSPTAFSRGNTQALYSWTGFAQQPCTVAVDRRRNGRNGETVSITWSGNRFTASLQAGETFLELLMPGEARKPEVVGGSTRSVVIEGSVDPVEKTLTVEARERYESTRQVTVEEPKETYKSTTICSAVSVPFLSMAEDGRTVEFGVYQVPNLLACRVHYRGEHASQGRFAGATWARSEESQLDQGAEEDACCIVRFTVAE